MDSVWRNKANDLSFQLSQGHDYLTSNTNKQQDLTSYFKILDDSPAKFQGKNRRPRQIIIFDASWKLRLTETESPFNAVSTKADKNLKNSGGKPCHAPAVFK